MRAIQLVAALFLVVSCVVSPGAWSVEGLLSVKSPHGPKATMDRLEDLLKKRGLTIFARVDHAAGAAKIGPMSGSARRAWALRQASGRPPQEDRDPKRLRLARRNS